MIRKWARKLMWNATHKFCYDVPRIPLISGQEKSCLYLVVNSSFDWPKSRTANRARSAIRQTGGHRLMTGSLQSSVRAFAEEHRYTNNYVCWSQRASNRAAGVTFRYNLSYVTEPTEISLLLRLRKAAGSSIIFYIEVKW